ncbi:MAG: hypothetical protein ACYCU7_04580 [Acidimicrobiales bacterium]
MKRLALGLAVLAAVGALVWALWPSPSWPAAFCTPVTRATGSDVLAIATESRSLTHAITAGERTRLARLSDDARTAAAHAPTSQLRGELRSYVSMLDAARSTRDVAAAIDDFAVKARVQLGGCGLRPVGVS